VSGKTPPPTFPPRGRCKERADLPKATRQLAAAARSVIQLFAWVSIAPSLDVRKCIIPLKRPGRYMHITTEIRE